MTKINEMLVAIVLGFSIAVVLMAPTIWIFLGTDFAAHVKALTYLANILIAVIGMSGILTSVSR